MEQTEHNYSHKTKEHVILESERPHKTAEPRDPYQDEEPAGHHKVAEPEYPHKTHDLSALSRYFLDVTAFTPNISMGSATQLHDSQTNIANTQYFISANLSRLRSNDLLKPAYKVIDHSTIDYDRLGILCEYSNLYYIVSQDPPAAADNPEYIRLNWIPKHLVGTHLISEWESIPKMHIGKHCIVAAVNWWFSGSVVSTDSWWHSHSQVIMDVRRTISRRLLCARDLPEDQFPQHMGAVVDDETERVYEFLYIREEHLAKEAESAIKEFTRL
jgi:hypothetical protein